MILFGMINWTFTWLRAEGPLTYADMADVVTQIFLHGAVAGPPVGRAIASTAMPHLTPRRRLRRHPAP
jgi:hypothetical protein